MFKLNKDQCGICKKSFSFCCFSIKSVQCTNCHERVCISCSTIVDLELVCRVCAQADTFQKIALQQKHARLLHDQPLSPKCPSLMDVPKRSDFIKLELTYEEAFDLQQLREHKKKLHEANLRRRSRYSSSSGSN